MKTIIYNAKAYIERETFAGAILIEDGFISTVGSNEKILSYASSDAVQINAEGHLVLPGFNDSHLHLHDFGRNLHRIQAYDVTSISELIERGKEVVARLCPPRGSVVTGTGWNQELFTDEKRHPNRFDLDKISTDHAIIIDRVCGHSVCCNTLAMEMAGVNRETLDVEGGHMDRDEKGDLLGIFRENAIYDIKKIIPPYTPEQVQNQLEYALQHAIENGLTSVSSRDIIDDNYQMLINSFVKIFEEGHARIRVTMQCSLDDEATFDKFIELGYVTRQTVRHPLLKMGPLKLFADGSLGSQTAYMRKPYADCPSTTGLRVMTQRTMDTLVHKAHTNGLQVIVHAIGDAAIDEVLNSFEKVTNKGSNPLRHAVVHCQIADKGLLERMAANNILAIVQPIFLTHDLYIVDSRVGGELASTSYAFNTMEKLGIRAAYGTDCPVESMNPLECIHCAVNRQDIESGYPKGGYYPQERVDVWTAVDNYTTGSAYATFEEEVKGRIKPGFYADLVMLDKDIFSIPPEEIKNARVLMTMVEGQIVYNKTFKERAGVEHAF